MNLIFAISFCISGLSKIIFDVLNYENEKVNIFNITLVIIGYISTLSTLLSLIYLLWSK